MTDETNIIETGTQVEDMTPDYLAAIKELKQNSVSRTEYDALKAENKKLLNSVINGQTVEAEPKKPEVDVQAIRNRLFQKDCNVMGAHYFKDALDLREALIEKGEPDPFLPIGRRISPTQEDIAEVEKCVAVYKECLEYSGMDDEAFTNELMRRTRDVRITK